VKIRNRHLIIVLAVAFVLGLTGSTKVFAATSPVLAGSAGYSVLGGAGVTCTGSTTTTGDVGVSPGSSITGFPSPCTAGGGTQNNNASAIAAQADILTAFGTLDQTCDHTYGAQDLTLLSPLGPGVYCSTSSFTLSGNLTLTGSGVWIFKTVSTLTTSPGSSVTGGDPCNVWWRIGSSATLDTTTAFIGTIIAQNGVTTLNTGATLNGRVLALSAGTVILNANTINGPTCAAGTSNGSGGSSSTVVPKLPNTGIGPEDKRSVSWNIVIPVAFVITNLALFYLVRKKRTT
jgi:Ice-binding-like